MIKLQSNDLKYLKKLAVRKNNAGKEREIKTDDHILKKLQSHDFIDIDESGIKITKQGISFLKRRKTEHESAYQAQHRIVKKETLDGEDVLINQTESPLKFLYNRKGKNGERIISKAQLLAGERLRQDFEKTQLMTISSVRLSPKVDQSSIQSNRFYAQEKTVEARKRLRNALNAVGDDMNSLLLDFCCFLKGLEAIEKERCWPARSAKVVLGLALSRLANHYGFDDEAKGKHKAVLASWHC